MGRNKYEDCSNCLKSFRKDKLLRHSQICQQKASVTLFKKKAYSGYYFCPMCMVVSSKSNERRHRIKYHKRDGLGIRETDLLNLLKDGEKRAYDDFDLQTINQFKINLENIEASEKLKPVSLDDSDLRSQKFYNYIIEDHL